MFLEADLNIDSLNFIAIVTKIENKYKIEIEVEKLLERGDIRVGDLARYVDILLEGENDIKI